MKFLLLVNASTIAVQRTILNSPGGIDVTSQRLRFTTSLGQCRSLLRPDEERCGKIQRKLKGRRGCRYTHASIASSRNFGLQIALILMEVGSDSLVR